MRSEEIPDTAVSLLMQEYGLLKQEVWMHSQHYESHIKYLQFTLTGLLAILVFLFGANAQVFEQSLGVSREQVYVIFAFLVTTASFLLIFKVLENNYRIVVVAARMAILEDMINERLGQPLLQWESLLSEKFSTTKGSIRNRNPSMFMAIYHVIVISGVAIILPLYLYWLAWSASGPLFRAAILVAAVYTFTSAAVASYIGLSIFGPLRAKLKAKMLGIMQANAGLPPASTSRQ